MKFYIALRILAVVIFLLPYHGTVKAQITSSTIEGKITEQNGLPLPSAYIRAVHEPTGTQYPTVSRDNGDYTLSNLKVGGPYTLVCTYIGYSADTLRNLYLALGIAKKANFILMEKREALQTLEIVGQKDGVAEGADMGITANISREQLENIPSLNRSLQEATRMSSQGNQSAFGGNNYRFNSLSIDGASNNDAVGFQEPASGAAGSVASGTPGALAGTQPISMDAIAQVQVAIAPFDTRQGNFTGANINAVTRSGTNILEGSVYTFGRNQWVTGRSIDEARTPIADYFDIQSGFRLGGALKKNKLFYFINYEHTRRNEPVLNRPGDPDTNIPFDVAQRIADTLRTRYGYDPGTFGDASTDRVSDKFFVRLDYNIGDRHQLTLRDNFVKASSENLERGSNFLNFGNQGFTHESRNNSAVMELKSRLGHHSDNHLIIGHNTINDTRSFEGRVFPHLRITYNTSNTIFAGTYREASVYGVKVNTTQFTDNLNLYKGRHTFTLGTQNEFMDIEYRFLTAWNGRWEYRSVEDFYNDRPRRIRGVYNRENNDYFFNLNQPSADFKVFLLSLYAQDRFKVSERLSLTAGLRIDMQLHPEKVPINPTVVATREFSHFDNDFGGVPQLNPRLGFHYQLDSEGRWQWHGGSGLFSGRIPFAWYAYSHYISGVEYGNIDLRPSGSLEITENLSDLRATQDGLTEVNLVDNDFKLPRTWRSSLSLDWRPKDDLKLSLSMMYSAVLDAVLFRSINLRDNQQRLEGADDRWRYQGSGTEKKINDTFTNVFLLTNTDQGFQYNLTLGVEKRLGAHLNTFLNYTYGESKDISNGVRNSLAANFNWNQSLNSNAPALAYSNFDLRHNTVLATDYHTTWANGQQSRVNIVVTARSGSPFSFTYVGDVNNDGSSQNDLLFIPEKAEDIVLVDIVDAGSEILVSAEEQWVQLDRYIENSDYLRERRGSYAERNGARTPWNGQVDLRLAHEIPMGKKGRKLAFTLDIINALNLIYRDWGRQAFVPNVLNSSFPLLDFVGLEDNRPQFQFKNPSGTPWQVDPLNSRWQAQVGLRYSF